MEISTLVLSALRAVSPASNMSCRSMLCVIHLGVCSGMILMGGDSKPAPGNATSSSPISATRALKGKNSNAYTEYYKSLNSPNDLAVDVYGNIYVADTWNQVIRMITPKGAITTLAGRLDWSESVDGQGAEARFLRPMALAMDRSGNFYVADGDTIRKITADGKVSTLAGSTRYGTFQDGEGADARFLGPSSIVVDGAGNIYVADSGNYVIRKMTPEGEVTTFAGTPAKRGTADGARITASFFCPLGISVDDYGNFYVADSWNHTIRKISADGVVSTLAGKSGERGSVDGVGMAARFSTPHGIAVDKKGSIYVTDSEDHIIRKITPDGLVSTMAGSPGLAGSADGIGSAAKFNNPRGIALDQFGNVYVADTFNNAIRKITPEGVVSTVYGGPSTEKKPQSKQRTH